jgi:predicted DNA-binding transcriptional regulator AlpA
VKRSSGTRQDGERGSAGWSAEHRLPDAAASERLLTVREVAALLRLTPEGIYAITRRGKLPCLALDTGARRPVLRWLQRDVVAYKERALERGRSMVRR